MFEHKSDWNLTYKDEACEVEVWYKPITVHDYMEMHTLKEIDEIEKTDVRQAWTLFVDLLDKIIKRATWDGKEVGSRIPDYLGRAVVLLHPSFRVLKGNSKTEET